MPQRSGSGGGFAEAFRKRIAEAQSQMNNAQLQSKGPGYGSQAARVAAPPSQPQPAPTTATASLIDQSMQMPDWKREIFDRRSDRGRIHSWSPPVVDGGNYYAESTPRPRQPSDSEAFRPAANAISNYSVRPVTSEDVQFNPLIRESIAGIRSVDIRNGAKVIGIDSDGNVLVRFPDGGESMVLAPGNESKWRSYPGYMDFTEVGLANGLTWIHKPNVDPIREPSNGVVFGRDGQPQSGAKLLNMNEPDRRYRDGRHQSGDKGKREK